MSSRAARVLLVGFGNMGRALAAGWLARGYRRDAIRVVDPVAEARTAAAALKLDAAPAFEPGDEAEPFDVVLFAVKPDRLAESAAACRAAKHDGPVFVSIAAGKPIAALTAELGEDAAIVRAMPNTPAAIGRGMTVLCANGAVSAAQRGTCTDLLSAVGRVEWLDDEALMDAVTAVSGSGPAYVFALIECLAEAGAAAGLPAALAAKLAAETVGGAAEYALRADVGAAELRRRVTSPQGTTQAALDVLLADAGGLSDLLRRAVLAATKRSRELSSL
jgi:pyrroline-5-carboxylate reductase